MKLGIVIPLKSKRVSRNWKTVTDCLAATLHSLENQTADSWAAVVVGHEKPELPWEGFSERVSWLTAPFKGPPTEITTRVVKRSDFDRILDKNRKISSGMRFLSAQEISDWFVLDADDVIHTRFVETMYEIPKQAGWVLKSGFLWYEDLKRICPSNRMAHLCGSTAVINSSVFDLPSSDDDDQLSLIPWCRLSHSDMEEFFSPMIQHGSVTFPFPAVAYTLSNGDNCSDEFRSSFWRQFKQWAKKRLLTKPITPEFARAFGIR